MKAKVASFPGLRAGVAAAWRCGPAALVAVRLHCEDRPCQAHRLGWLPGRGTDVFARDTLLIAVEAALFAAAEPLTPRKLARLAGLPDAGEARRQVAKLNALLDADRSAFRVEELAGGYQLLTCPDWKPWLERIFPHHDDLALSGPMLETLSIVAYRQPICRADVEKIRGVQVGEILQHLLEKGLIRLAGRDSSLGRPFLYGTTRKFLQAFGLRNLNELPLAELLTRPADEPSPTEEKQAEPAATPSAAATG